MTLDTARLTLREVAAGDEALLVALRTDPAVRRYLGGPMSLDDATTSARFAVLHSQGLFVARRKADDEPIGMVLLHPGHGGTEVSYQFLPLSWSQGFGTEAVRCIIDYAFDSLGVGLLLVVTQTANERSRRLLARLGLSASDQFEEFGEQQSLYRVPRPSDA